MNARLLADEIGLARLADAVAEALRRSPAARRREALLGDTRAVHGPVRRVRLSGAGLLPFAHDA
ncbi:MAG TPA: hypothetical protein VM434_12655 [Beijerinckiaceae bacterium]|nr:hypothetical protein [Beijerinckiaceae bacterium]